VSACMVSALADDPNLISHEVHPSDIASAFGGTLFYEPEDLVMHSHGGEVGDIAHTSP
jgi:hypothetical protein